MSEKQTYPPVLNPGKALAKARAEARVAAMLRENLKRRKALVRARQGRTDAEGEVAGQGEGQAEDLKTGVDPAEID